MPWLAVLFFLTAALYASVGFGGGSTYIALLALTDMDYRTIPIIALICNIIVVSGGTIRFYLGGLIEWRRILPILALSMPAAWLGGRIAIERDFFLLLLGISLLAAALLLLAEPFFQRKSKTISKVESPSGWFAPTVGSGVGFISGMVGIGGGIFLAPILLLTRWANNRRVAATASIFILVNSIAGLAGHLMKPGSASSFDLIAPYWMLFLGVFLGGQIGSFMATKALPDIWIRRLTAVLILYVAGRLLWQQWL